MWAEPGSVFCCLLLRASSFYKLQVTRPVVCRPGLKRSRDLMALLMLSYYPLLTDMNMLRLGHELALLLERET